MMQQPKSNWCITLASLLLASFISSVSAATLSVTVVLSDRSEIYQSFYNALQSGLAGQDISLSLSDGHAPVRGANLVVVVAGTRAASELPETDAPTLYTLLPKARYEELTKAHPHGAVAEQTAIYLDQPAVRQIRLMAAALPRFKRIGILVSPAMKEAVAQLSHEAAGYGLKLHVIEVNGQDDLADALNEAMERSDALLALPDAAIYNGSTIRNLLLSSFRSGKPVIGFSAGFVKAGAVAAVSSSPEQFGAQAAAMILQFASTGKLPPPQYSKSFEVTVNKTVASSMKLPLKDAKAIELELVKQERRVQ